MIYLEIANILQMLTIKLIVLYVQEQGAFFSKHLSSQIASKQRQKLKVASKVCIS